jgi:tetratricopeptide (TPR) repeat protein
MKCLIVLVVWLASIQVVFGQKIDVKFDRDKAFARLKLDQEYRLTTTLKAYQEIGNQDPKWNEPVEKVLRWHAGNLDVRHSIKSHEHHIRFLLEVVVDEMQCNDPYIQYLAIHYALRGNATVGSRAWIAAKNIVESKYPPVRKAEAVTYLFNSLFLPDGVATDFFENQVSFVPWYTMWANTVVKALQSDDELVHSELFREISFMCKQMQNINRNSSFTYQTLERLLLANLSQESSNYWIARARIQTALAYSVRGTDTADKTKDSQFIEMSARLKDAKKSLEKALKMKATNVVIYLTLMEIELSHGSELAKMEEYFQKCISIDPAYLPVYDSKMIFLYPQWHGESDEDFISFARKVYEIDFPWSGKDLIFKAHQNWSGVVRKEDFKTYAQKLESKPEITGFAEWIRKTYPHSPGGVTVYAILAGEFYPELLPNAKAYFLSNYGMVARSYFRTTRRPNPSSTARMLGIPLPTIPRGDYDQIMKLQD